MARPTHAHLRPRVAAALAATLALLAAAAGAQASSHRPCAHAHTPAAQASRAQMRAAVTCLVNRERTRRGLPALRDSRLLDHSAQGWTDKMIAIHQFTHGADFAATSSTLTTAASAPASAATRSRAWASVLPPGPRTSPCR